ncbi:hypothetical protein Dip510_001437 [Elusimicrobium posterum]|uniref:DUF6985 domain-containing protein n=1 Tax=Elusimicrobium posterum TaxID=3116653 RepID=UPI003C765968
MTEKIRSNILGDLSQNKDFPDWWESKGIEISFFDNKILPITFMDFEPEHDKTYIEEADKALENFLKLDHNYRKSISELVYQNCKDFIEAVGIEDFDESLTKIKDKNDIWNFVYPSHLYIKRRPYKEQDIYVQIECECAWEEEHGLQLVFRQGKKITRVSEIDGHLTEADAWNKADEEDELLSKF